MLPDQKDPSSPDPSAAGHDLAKEATTPGLPVDTSLAPTLAAVRAPVQAPVVNRRVVYISLLSIAVAVGAGLVAQALTRLIGLITNISFYGRFSTAFSSPKTAWPGSSSCFRRSMGAAMARASGPASRTTPIPPRPGAVATATMVSSSSTG